MPKVSLEFVFFIVILLVVAVAFDMWLIRAWNRYRRLHKRDTKSIPASGLRPAADTNPPPAFGAGGSPPAPAVPSSASKRGGVKQSKAPPAEAVVVIDSPPSRSKRPGKIVSQKASLSVQGNSGRTAHVEISMELPEGESFRLTLESVGPGAAFPAAAKTKAESVRVQSITAGAPAAAAAPRISRPNRWLERGRSLGASFLQDTRSAGRTLFLLALAVYLLTRLIGLDQWPIYFFTDEAVQTNFAAGLVQNHFVWQKEFLPTFFNNAGQFEMNVSVYVQVIPYLLFGKSVLVTRGVSVLITLLGAAAMGWILRRIFRLPLWWSGVLIFSVIPVWFLHSRTAFEPAESITFYIAFLYFYMRYRDDKPWLLLPALGFGALAAYTYSPAQVVTAVTGALLLLSDAPYHWRHKKVALAGLGVLVVVALPYVRFLILHPEGNRDQLAIVSSIWVDTVPLTEKLRLFFTEYLRGMDPRFWYLPNPPEGVTQTIIRHLMKGYGHLALWSLPFTLLGLLLCLWNIRLSKFRTVLISLLAAPVGGAIAQITITRALFMVVPSALLTSLGVGWLLGLFERRDGADMPGFLAVWRDRATALTVAYGAFRATAAERINLPSVRAFLRRWKERTAQAAATSLGLARVPRLALALGLFLILGSVNGYMLWDSVVNGPTWYRDYTLYGMQYGGRQLCQALIEYQEAHPAANLIVSSSWANGTDEIFEFFLPQGFPMQIKTIREYIQDYVPIADQDVFIMTPEEYQLALASGRFAEVSVISILPYPDGTPGFYFTHPRYIDNVQEVIAAEKAELAKPVEDQIVLGDETVRVVHSRLDMGTLASAFDGDPFSVMRGLQDNPLYLEMFFPVTHSFTSVRVHLGGAPTKVTVTIYPSDGSDPKTFSAEVERASDYRDLVIPIPAPVESSHIRLDFETVGESAPTHVHVYEIQLEGVGWKNGLVNPLP
jgi:hypothetical protein